MEDVAELDASDGAEVSLVIGSLVVALAGDEHDEVYPAKMRGSNMRRRMLQGAVEGARLAVK